MKNQDSIMKRLFETPNKNTQYSQAWYNSSRGYKSTQRHRKPIFKDTSYNTTATKYNPSTILTTTSPMQHLVFNQLISDDFCGCQITLNTCNRIIRGYFSNISLTELKTCYENQPKPQQSITTMSKKMFLSQLPAEYPQIYYTHLTNLLNHFETSKMTVQRFLLLAWVHVHCKLQHITFFFYNDLREYLKQSSFFYSQLELTLLKYNVTLSEEIRYFENEKLQIKSFLNDFYQSAGANLVPYTQYAKFLEIVKEQGLKAFIQLISLFIIKKKTQFKEILKYWTYNQIPSLRNYSRYLNWDLFFNQIKSLQ